MTIRFTSTRKTLSLPRKAEQPSVASFPVRTLNRMYFQAMALCGIEVRGTDRVVALRGRAATALALIALCTLLGASQGQLQAQRKSKESAADDKVNKPSAADSSGGAVDPHSYKIGPEDVLGIKVWREPDLSGQFVVRPDGKITLPLSGEVMAGGLTPVELTKVVTDAYGKLVNGPEVLINVESVRSKKYFLVGEVNKAGQFPLVVQTTVLDAINSAGGLREFANDKNIVIIRGEKRIKFNYRDVIRGKNLEQNIYLENGDHIVVR